jgi:membrane-associated PAP2 superfamily phosphatase
MHKQEQTSIKRIFYIFGGLFLASMASYQSGLDMALANAIFKLEGGVNQFPWKNSFLLDDIIHEGGRALAKRMFFITLIFYIASLWITSLHRWNKTFLYVALTALLSTTMISTLKQLTTLPCPDSLITFGGTREWISFWQLLSPSLPGEQCFPAGHSSGGYAWLCMAFAFPFASRRFYLLLIPGMVLGLTYGIAQQFRGMHFLSHDLMTISICWLNAGLMSKVINPLPTTPPAIQHQEALEPVV